MKALMISALAGALGLAACGGGSGSPVAASGTAIAVTAATTRTSTTVAVSTATESPTTLPSRTPASEPTTQPAPPTTAVPVVTVVNVVDGDTVDLSTGERVRIIGIDTPERGACGFQEASDALATMVAGQAVVVAPGARDDIDKYGRILRYIDVRGVDVGLSLIQQGLAIARYDSRDGYGHHTREDLYVEADAGSTSICPPAAPPPDTTAPASSVYYANCTEARAAGAAPLHEGEPGYRPGLDRDHDGVACE